MPGAPVLIMTADRPPALVRGSYEWRGRAPCCWRLAAVRWRRRGDAWACPSGRTGLSCWGRDRACGPSSRRRGPRPVAAHARGARLSYPAPICRFMADIYRLARIWRLWCHAAWRRFFRSDTARFGSAARCRTAVARPGLARRIQAPRRLSGRQLTDVMVRSFKPVEIALILPSHLAGFSFISGHPSFRLTIEGRMTPCG